MKKELKRALRASVLSAGAWADRFDSDTLITVYPPYIPAGIKSLKRAGRTDLIPAFIKRTQRVSRFDVTSLSDAMQLIASDLK